MSPGGGEVPALEENLFGLQGNLTYYFRDRVGFTVDGAFNTGTITAEAYGTIGWAIGSIDVTGVNENDLPVFRRLDDSVFAASFGASVDVMLGDGAWGVRLAQVEALVATYEETLTNFRYAAGIVGTF